MTQQSSNDSNENPADAENPIKYLGPSVFGHKYGP